MGLRELRKELTELEKPAIIHHLLEVYKRYPEVKEYFDFYVDPDEDELLEKYKAMVHEGFYPSRGKRLKLYRSRKAMNAFKKLVISEEAVASLLLYFPQVAVMYAREQRVSGEAYYTRIETSFRQALEFMSSTGQLSDFRTQAQALVDRCEPFPWHCSVHMTTIFRHFFPQERSTD
jgi:hypothetical protein